MFLFCLVFAMSLCASVYMCFVVTCWEIADRLALVCGVCCEFVTFPLVSWVRCGTWLYRFLIFAPLLTLMRRLSLIGIDAIWQLSLGCLLVRTIASFLRYTGYLNFINGPINRVLLLILVHVQILSCLFFWLLASLRLKTTSLDIAHLFMKEMV